MIFIYRELLLVERGNNDSNEKSLGAPHGSGLTLGDAATGSPVIEIGYTQYFLIAVPEEVGMVTYQ
ncbi:hypothetical protein BACCIP111883_01183 [Sutcliffiella rhizosphaerae]|uniref:Uncharacterized protein n=1 Tax=Sutcliffiella rhizosphaerae TaxID=2880967 RepID=A0ABN8A5S6_9BACI|nr:hypothetical protein BACCIP111883_01183 [Sutcliffiella rhizosphaerae]